MITHTTEPTSAADSNTDSDVSPIKIPRSSGVLLHISSLPGRFGIGDLGPNAYRFADFLAETGQRIWQVLPLVPVGLGNSPYSSPSTFAVNPLFISPDLLLDSGLLSEIPDPPDLPADHADYGRVIEYKYDLLGRTFDEFEGAGIQRTEFDRFCAENAYWLDDYALFMALKTAFHGKPWTQWPDGLVARDPDALERAHNEHAAQIERHKFYQYLFFRQWDELKSYCNDRSISLFGDLPIYVAHDSADVWAHRDLFFLDEAGRSTVVAGVPPDYFSETGQRWGNPIYRWDWMRQNDYAWWARRFENIFTLVDLIRLDHFRAFAGYWEIPAEEDTAINGRWVDGPGSSLFNALERKLGPLPLVAENLGMITPDVTELMQEFGFPGMAVLQFAFHETADHPFLPHNLERNVVAYTGTHDNDTIAGWWQSLRSDPATNRSVRFARQYLALDHDDDEMHWAAIRAMLASPSDYVLSPMQDLLGLGTGARMNTPGRAEGNWSWRFRWDQVTPDVTDRLRAMTAVYGRSDMLDEVV